MPSKDFLSEYLTRPNAAKALKVGERTLERWTDKGSGPPVTMIGRTAYYRIEALQAWLRECERNSKAA